ncbi:transposase [bacterium]|nr:MAG: transposase [bacterium]
MRISWRFALIIIMNTNKGWHSRGYLPHFDSSETLQVVTFRLADSLPLSVLNAWQKEVEELLPDGSARKRELQRRINIYLDAGYGACELDIPKVAVMMEQAMLYFDSIRYRLISWVIMPNHVHTLIEIWDEFSLGQILGSWKSFVSHEMGKMSGRVGQFWQPDYFDRFIRDEPHFYRAVSYIENNPVKAGLCAVPEDWPYGSARFNLRS